jgi:hypothetical protein
MVKEYHVPGSAISATLIERPGRNPLVMAIVHLPRKHRFRRWLFKSILALVAVYSDCDINFQDGM